MAARDADGKRIMANKNPHAVALGRRGGQVGGKVKSAAKAAAARLNGKKGGRPKKLAVVALLALLSACSKDSPVGPTPIPTPRPITLVAV